MFFVSQFAQRFDKKIDAISQDAMAQLSLYSWPGNIRELQNIIERGVVLAQGPVLALSPGLLQGAAAPEQAASASADRGALRAHVSSPTGPAKSSSDSPATLEEIERHHILSVLEQARWVIEGVRGAARILNLHPNTLRSRMKKLGIRRPTHEI
jgi:formate hydrogenlyase transcriptional activator